MKNNNSAGWAFDFLHLKWLLFICQRLPALMVGLFFGLPFLGIFASIGIYQYTHSSTLGALGLWFFMTTGFLSLFFVRWLERYFAVISLRKVLHNRTIAQIYTEYRELKDEALQRDIERYCAAVIYKDSRFSSEVLYLSSLGELISLEDLRQKVPQLQLSDPQAVQIVRELADFVFNSHLYDDWVMVGTHPK